MSANGRLYGNRGLIVEDDHLDAAYRNVIEGNRFAFMGDSVDNGPESGLTVRTPKNIVRKNMFYHNAANGMNLYTNASGTCDTRHQYIYNNVFYKNGVSARDERYKWGFAFDNSAGTDAPIPIEDILLKNNLLFPNTTGGDIYFYHTDPSLQTVTGNYYVKAANDGTLMAPLPGNTVNALDPRFAQIPALATVANILAFDFHLTAASPAIDKGAFLTTTTGAGAGTLMGVADAGYFMDGFGIAEGDLIQLQGQTRTARVVRIDYTLNQLTLGTALTWSAGQGVALAYTGPAPDCGAHEYAGSTAPQPPRGLKLR